MPPKQSQQRYSAAGSSLGQNNQTQAGTLYLIAVPIGHADDLTLRAMQLLREVNLIASEDPKATQELLSHHKIVTPITSYGPRNLNEKVAVLLQRLQQGWNIALVSDCGSPLIVDPGLLLVDAVSTHGIPVVTVPGPSALIAAVTISGFAGDSFVFVGQLPTTRSGLLRCLTETLGNRIPTVAFCTVQSARQAAKMLGELAPRRVLVLACDLTKPTERIIRGTARRVQEELRGLKKLEATLIIEGGQRGPRIPRTRRPVQSVSSRRIKMRYA